RLFIHVVSLWKQRKLLLNETVTRKGELPCCKRLFYFLQLHPKTYLPAPVIIPFSPRSCGILETSSAIHRIAENGEILSRIIPDECCWFPAQSTSGLSRISNNLGVRHEQIEILFFLIKFLRNQAYRCNFSLIEVYLVFLRGGPMKILVGQTKNNTCWTNENHYWFCPDNSGAFLDCSHRARDKEWFCRKNTMVHPSRIQVLRQREDYEFASERNDPDGSYIAIGTADNQVLRNIGDATDDEFDNENENGNGNGNGNETTPKMEVDDTSKHFNVLSTRKDGNIS
ncbi:uncharacterized protein LOC128884590, partial [Hylaeus volcanicus]|uniref:uncharacterized protein LOC128884590 n=1 Tax=Hylaeus volcanicus TaxID=313075 RepID=UPI0023B7BB53